MKSVPDWYLCYNCRKQSRLFARVADSNLVCRQCAPFGAIEEHPNPDHVDYSKYFPAIPANTRSLCVTVYTGKPSPYYQYWLSLPY